MSQNNTRGGSSNQAKPMTGNEQMTAGQALQQVMARLEARREEIAAVLPPDINFDHYRATVNQALRGNPDILKATPMSIVNACIKAAYDGLRLDSREAALVTHQVKVGKNPDRWETHAQYFPMVFGLIQQVLRGGEIVAMEADIIYANDEYKVQRGTAAGIIHIPLLQGDRGEAIAVYSTAVYKTGYVGFHLMTKDEIEDVRLSSKTGNKDGKPAGIWLRWWRAMWKKTVIRQHRKMLPLGGRDFYDAEERDEFDALAAHTALPDASIPARPTRGTALEHNPLPAAEDFGFGNQLVDDDGELVDAKVRTAPADGVKKTAVKGNELKGEVVEQLKVPEDEAAWSAWAKDLEERILKASGIADVTAIQTTERLRIDLASQERRDFIKSLITDRMADLATDTAAGEANGGEDQSASKEQKS